MMVGCTICPLAGCNMLPLSCLSANILFQLNVSETNTQKCTSLDDSGTNLPTSIQNDEPDNVSDDMELGKCPSKLWTWQNVMQTCYKHAKAYQNMSIMQHVPSFSGKLANRYSWRWNPFSANFKTSSSVWIAFLASKYQSTSRCSISAHPSQGSCNRKHVKACTEHVQTYAEYTFTPSGYLLSRSSSSSNAFRIMSNSVSTSPFRATGRDCQGPARITNMLEHVQIVTKRA